MEKTSVNGTVFLTKLEAEANATRKCLERISEDLFEWKPQEKSMTLGYPALLVAANKFWFGLFSKVRIRKFPKKVRNGNNPRKNNQK